MVQVVTDAETIGAQQSGQMGLVQTIEDMTSASQNLRQGIFRLLVLGDMKRGKSPFLKALIKSAVVALEAQIQQLSKHEEDSRAIQKIEIKRKAQTLIQQEFKRSV